MSIRRTATHDLAAVVDTNNVRALRIALVVAAIGAGIAFLVWGTRPGKQNGLGTRIPDLSPITPTVSGPSDEEYEVYSFPSEDTDRVIAEMRSILGKEEQPSPESADATEELVWPDPHDGWRAVLYRESNVELTKQFTKAPVPANSGAVVVRHPGTWSADLLGKVKELLRVGPSFSKE